jgi:hypothetical protein
MTFSYFILTTLLSTGPFDPTQLCGDLLIRYPQNQQRTERGYLVYGETRGQDVYTETGGLMPIETRPCDVKLRWKKAWMLNSVLDQYTAVPANIVEGTK